MTSSWNIIKYEKVMHYFPSLFFFLSRRVNIFLLTNKANIIPFLVAFRFAPAQYDKTPLSYIGDYYPSLFFFKYGLHAHVSRSPDLLRSPKSREEIIFHKTRDFFLHTNVSRKQLISWSVSRKPAFVLPDQLLSEKDGLLSRVLGHIIISKWIPCYDSRTSRFEFK